MEEFDYHLSIILSFGNLALIFLELIRVTEQHTVRMPNFTFSWRHLVVKILIYI
jgi:hypothetical protein